MYVCVGGRGWPFEKEKGIGRDSKNHGYAGCAPHRFANAWRGDMQLQPINARVRARGGPMQTLAETHVDVGLGWRLEGTLVNLELVHTVAEDPLEQRHDTGLLAGPRRAVEEHMGHVARLGNRGELLRQRVMVVELGKVLRAVLVHPQRHYENVNWRAAKK